MITCEAVNCQTPDLEKNPPLPATIDRRRSLYFITRTVHLCVQGDGCEAARRADPSASDETWFDGISVQCTVQQICDMFCENCHQVIMTTN